MFLDEFLLLLSICMVNSVQGLVLKDLLPVLNIVTAQQYILDPQYHFRAPQGDYYNEDKPLQFQQQFNGFPRLDSYVPQRDLQTSDLPFHLQKTLPQYRFKEQLPKNELPYHNNVIFRPDHERAVQNVAPSTHRPNYSHFLSQNYNRNPSQTETFLGQITLDNSFGNLDNNYYNVQGNKKLNEWPKPISDKFLRQHTRILAPDSDEKQNQLQENKYFVNENGEVFSTTVITPTKIFPPKRLSTKLEVEEENPISQELPRNNIIDTDKSAHSSKSQDQIFNSANNFDLTDYEYEDEEIKSTPKTKIITEKPQTTQRPSTPPEDNFSSKNIHENNNNSSNIASAKSNKETKVDEPIVSVVTTKSVINNTVIATTSTPPYSSTESIPSTSVGIENSTDSWVVVASVQTSKSISGAHYLPSSIVAQEERFTSLNEKERQDKLNEDVATTEEYSSNEDYDIESTTEEFTTHSAIKHSTESLIDKLDRVQSDLSSGLLTGGYKSEDNNIAVITENMTDKVHIAEMTEPPTVAPQIIPPAPKSNFPIIKKFSAHSRPPTSNLYPKRKQQSYKKPPTNTTPSAVEGKAQTKKEIEPKIIIAKPDAYLPPGYKQPAERDSSSELLAELLKKFKQSTNANKIDENELNPENGDSKTPNAAPTDNSPHRFGSTNLKNETTSNSTSHESSALLKIAKPVDIKSFLPPGYKEEFETTTDKSSDSILRKAKLDDISAFLPPGYKEHSKDTNTESTLSDNKKEKNTTAALHSVSENSTVSNKKLPSAIEAILGKSKQEDISSFLPPGYKLPSPTSTKKPAKLEQILQNSKEDDISAFLPPGYKSKSSSSTPKSKPKIEDIFEQSKKDDISAFLPPGYRTKSFSTRKPTSLKPSIEIENLPTSLLPSGYKPRKDIGKGKSSTESSITTSSMSSTTTTGKHGLKIVFPSRPGGKRINHKSTTSRPKEENEVTQAYLPTIHKGWPTRATTEFTGWPTPSTTPISIEKLLASVQRSSPTSAEPENITTTTSTQTTVITTTTTIKPTTPGICVEECDLVGTIKLVDGVKWVPELLDRNTKEWQLLANEVQTQLEEVYTKSQKLGELFKNLRIDGFSQGSVLVDYLVEMNNVNMHVSTLQIKRLFNEALESTLVKTPREGKSLNETKKFEEKAKLGKFIIDPEYTDFIIVPKQIAPTVGYAEDNLLLPQWAIAVIVIGLASLLFVIIFGVTVLVNRSKNAKKKIPTPLTEDMLNELNKNHMGGYDNYSVEDPYSVEAGFWDPRRMDAHREYKLPKKGSSGSIHDNSMTNLYDTRYDSWKSQWNGHYNNSTGGLYGNHGPGSSHRLYERRRSYDTNF